MVLILFPPAAERTGRLKFIIKNSALKENILKVYSFDFVISGANGDIRSVPHSRGALSTASRSMRGGS